MPSRSRPARHRSAAPGSARRAVSLRSLWAGTAVVAGAVAVALVATGGTYALWNGAVSPTAAQVRSGSAALAITGAPSLRAPLAPGASIATSFVATNAGDVPLALRVAVTSTKSSSGADGAGSGALGELTLRAAPVASAAACTTSVTTGTSARLASFDTGAAPGWATASTTASGSSSAVVGCLVLTLDADAPQAASGAVVDLVVTVTGTQVLP